MGIFGRVPSGGGPGTSRKDRRQVGVRARSKTVARRETERRAQVIIIAGIILTAVAVLGILGFGYYQTTVKPKHQTVLRVGDRSFSMSYMEKRLGYEIRNAGAGTLLTSNEQVAVTLTLNNTEDEEINRIGAARQNISVSEDEIDAKIHAKVGIANTPDQQAAFADAYRKAVQDSGLSAKDYREIIAAELLEEKIRQSIISGIPTTADQVRLFDIRVASEQEAQKVVERLTAGEDFSAMATELSLDSDTKDKGGEMGWMPKASLGPAAGEAVFALEAGQWTQPVADAGSGSYFVYKVAEKATAMEVTAEQQKTIEDRTFSDQQEQLRQETPISRPYMIDTKMASHLMEVAVKKGVGAAANQ